MLRSGRRVRKSVRRAARRTVTAGKAARGNGLGAVAVAATAAAAALWGGTAYGKGNIKVDNVAAGSAKVQVNGRNTVITATNRTIINYSQFNVAANESVRFVQPGRNSTVLNRINSADPSRINGRLTANGIVYFVNPAGVVFGANAVVNVGTMYAAAANISNSDFLANTNHFVAGASGGIVSNAGVIKAEAVYLIGRQVSNTGAIMADKVVTMASGNDVLIGDASGGIFVNVAPVTQSAPAAAPRMSLGAGDMYSIAVRNTGSIKAPSITLQTASGGAAVVGGTLDASNKHAGKVGGNITVTGGDVTLTGAIIDASGSAGGGYVKIGGDFHGAGATASNTTVDAATSIHADALKRGDGGRVVVWSDNTTAFHGSITARGGALGGDGGKAETSGKMNLDILGGTADLTAPFGKTGTLLLDPDQITIGVAAPVAVTPAGTDLTTDSDLSTLPVSTLTQLLQTADVTLEATNKLVVGSAVAPVGGTSSLTLIGGTGITVNAPITIGGGLTLTATTGDINVAANIQSATFKATASAGLFTLAAAQTISTSGAGVKSIDVSSKTLTMGAGSAFNANGGGLSLVASGTISTAALATVGATSDLVVTSTGADVTLTDGVTSAGKVTVGAATMLTVQKAVGGAGDVTITTSAGPINSTATGSITSTARKVSIAATGGGVALLGDVAANGTLDITGTSVGAAKVTGATAAVTITGNAGAVTLTGPVDAGTGDLKVQTTGTGTDVTTGILKGANVTVDALGKVDTTAGAITATAAVSLTAQGGALTTAGIGGTSVTGHSTAALDTTAGSIAAGTGSVSLTATGTGGVTIGNITAGTTTLTAGGAITDKAGTTITSSDAVTANAATGISLDVLATNGVTAKTTDAIAGNISLRAAGALTLNEVSTVQGTISAVTTGAGHDLTIATGPAGKGVTAIGTGAPLITLDASGNLVVNQAVTATGGDISLHGGGGVTIAASVQAAGHNVTGLADALDLSVTAGTASGAKVDLTATLGNIVVSGAGTILSAPVINLTASAGDISQSNGTVGIGTSVVSETATLGNITQTGGKVVGATLNLTAPSLLVPGTKGNISVLTTADGIVAVAGGSIGITEDDGLTIKATSNAVLAANGAITVVAGNALPVTPASLLIDTVTSAGPISLTNKMGDILNLAAGSSINSHASGTTVVSLTGNIGAGYDPVDPTFTTKLGAGPLNISSSGNLAITGVAVHLNLNTGGDLDVVAPGLGTSKLTQGGQTIDLTYTSDLTLETAANLTDTGGKTLGGPGKVTLVSDGASIGTSAAPVLAGGAALVGKAFGGFAVASTGAASFGPIRAGGQIDLSTRAGDLTLAGNVTGLGVVDVNAAGNILETAAVTKTVVTGTTVNLAIAAGSVNGAIGTVANPVLTATANLSAAGKGTGDVQLQNTGDVAITNLASGTGNVAVTVKTGGVTQIIAASGGTTTVIADNNIAAIAGSSIAGSATTVTAGKGVNFGLGAITGTTSITVTALAGDATVPTLASGTVGVTASGTVTAPGVTGTVSATVGATAGNAVVGTIAAPIVTVTAGQNAGVTTATGGTIGVSGATAGVGSAIGTTAATVGATTGNAVVGTIGAPTVSVTAALNAGVTTATGGAIGVSGATANVGSATGTTSATVGATTGNAVVGTIGGPTVSVTAAQNAGVTSATGGAIGISGATANVGNATGTTSAVVGATAGDVVVGTIGAPSVTVAATGNAGVTTATGTTIGINGATASVGSATAATSATVGATSGDAVVGTIGAPTVSVTAAKNANVTAATGGAIGISGATASVGSATGTTSATVGATTGNAVVGTIGAPTVSVTAALNAGVTTATGAGIGISGATANVGNATGTVSATVGATGGDAVVGVIGAPTVSVTASQNAGVTTATGAGIGISGATANVGSATGTASATVGATSGNAVVGTIGAPTVTVTALQNAGVTTATGGGINVTGGSANVGSATGTTSVGVTANTPSGDATIGSLSAPTVTVGAGHDIVGNGSPNISGTTAALTAGHEIGTDLAPINTAVSSLSASLTTTGGAGIFISNTKATGLTITGIDATAATPAAGAPIHLIETAGNLTFSGPVNAGVSSVVVDLVAGKTFTDNSTITGQALVTITSDKDVLAGAIVGGTGVVTLKPATAGFGITLGGTVAGTLSLTSADLNTAFLSGAGQLVVGSGGASGAGKISFAGPITLSNAPQLTLVTHQNVVTTVAGTVFTGSRLAIVADGGTSLAGGVGTAANPLVTQAGTVAVSASGGSGTSGGIYVVNSGVPLSLGTLGGNAGQVVGVATVGKDVVITNTLDLTVNSPVATTGAGIVSLTTTGSGNLNVNAAITTDSGSIALHSAGGLTFAGGPVVQTNTGAIALTSGAGKDITLSSLTTGYAGAGPAISVTAGGAILNGGLDPTTVPNLTASSVFLSAQTGIGTGSPLAVASPSITATDASTPGGNPAANGIDLRSLSNLTAAPVTAVVTLTGAGGINFQQTGGQNLTIASVTTINGDISIGNNGGVAPLLNVTSISAGTSHLTKGTVNLTSGGDIQAQTVTAFIDANLTATRNITQATTVTAGANATLTAGTALVLGGIQFGTVTATAGDATLSATGGGITGTSVLGNGGATLTATTDINLTSVKATINTASLTAGHAISVNSVNGGLDALLHTTTGNITVPLGGTVGSVVAGRDVTIAADGGSVSLQSTAAASPLSAGRDVLVTAGTDIFVQSAASGTTAVIAVRDVTLNAGRDLTVHSVVPATALPAAADSVSAGRTASLNGGRDLTVDVVTAGTSASLTATARNLVTTKVTTTVGDAALTAGGSLTLHHTGATAGLVNAHGAATLTAGGDLTVELASLAAPTAGALVKSAVGDVSLVAGGNATVNNVSAAGNLTLTAGSGGLPGTLTIINATAGGTATVLATTDVILTHDLAVPGNITAQGAITVTAGHDITADRTIDVAPIPGALIRSVGSSVTLRAGGHITAELVEAATFVDSQSNSSDTIINHVITTTGDAVINSQGDLTVGTVQSTVGKVLLTAVGDIFIQHFDNGVGKLPTPASITALTDVSITAGHDLLMELGITPGVTPTRSTITALNGRVDLSASNSIVVNDVHAATGVSITASKANLANTGDLTVVTINSTGGDVTLSANHDVTIKHDLTTAGLVTAVNGSVIATAGNNLTVELASTASPVAGASVLGSGGTINFAAGNDAVINNVTGQAGVTLKAGTNLVAGAGDLTVITAKATTGDVLLAANNNLSIRHDQATRGSVTALAGKVTATAQNDLTVELASSALAAGAAGATVNAATDVSLTATRNLTAYNVVAGNNAALGGGSLKAVAVTATGGTATLTSVGGDLTILHDTGKAVPAGPVVTTKGNVTAKGDVSLTSGHDLTLELDSVAGGLGLGGSVTSQTGGVTLTALNNVTANKVTATLGSATLTAGSGSADGQPGDLVAVTVTAGAGATLTASHDLTIRHDLANPPSGVRGSVIAQDDVILHAGNDLTVELPSAANVPGSLVQSVNKTVTLTAGHDITVASVASSFDATITAAHSLTVDTVTGGHNATLTAVTGDITSLTSVIATTNDATLTAGHTVNSATVTAGHDATLTGTSGDVNNSLLVHAGHDATLLAGGNVSVVTVTAGHNASLTGTAGGVTSTLLVQAGNNASLTAGTNVTANVVTATAGNATLLAGNTVTADKVTAGLVASLTATAGDLNSTTLVKSGTDAILFAGHTVHSLTVDAGHDAKLTATSGDVNNTLLVNAGNDATLLAGTNVAAVTVTAGHNASLTGTAGSVNSTLLVKAGNDAALTAGTNVTAKTVTATAGNATLLAGNTVTADKVTAGLAASLTATAGDVNSTTLVKAGTDATLLAGHTIHSVTVDAGHDAKLTATSGDVISTLLVNAGNDATLLGGANVSVATVTAGHNANLMATAGNLTSTLLVHAGNDASLTAGVDINVKTVTATAGNATLLAGNNLTADKVTAGLVASLTATNGDVNSTTLVKSGTDVIVLAGHTIHSVTVDAGHDATLTATTGDVISTLLVNAGNDATLLAANTVSTATVTAGHNVTLTGTGGDVVSTVLIQAGFDVTLKAGQNITVNQLIAGHNVSLTAGNDIGEISLSAGHDVLLDAGRDVVVNLLTVGTNNSFPQPATATLKAGRSIVDANGLSLNVTSPFQSGISPVLVATAGVKQAGNIELDTKVAKITAADLSGGSIVFRSIRDVELVDVSTVGGPVTVTSGATVTATKVVANGGDVKITTTGGNILVGLIESLGGGDRVVALKAAAAIEQIDATDGTANIVSTGTIDLQASSGIGALGRIDVTAPTLLAATNAGNITLHSIPTGPVNATLAVKTGAGNIDLLQDGGPLTIVKATTASGDITLLNTSGDLTLTKVAAGGAGSVFATTNGGSINVDSVSASGPTVNFDSAGNITDVNGNGALNVSVRELKAKAVGFINLDTAVDHITAQSTGVGDVTFRELDAVTLDSIKTASGKVNVVSGGTMTVKLVQAAGDVTLQTKAGDIQTDTIIANGSLVKMTAAGSITDLNGDGVVNVTARELRALASGGINLDTALDNITAESTSHGDILLREADAVTLDSVKTAGGKIDVTSGGTMTAKVVTAVGGTLTLTTHAGDIRTGVVTALGNKAIFNAAGSITDLNGDSSINVSAADLHATAGGSINLDTALDTITATSHGTIDLRERDAIELVSVTSGGAKITVHNAGRMLVDFVNAGAGEVVFVDNGGEIDPGSTPGGVNVIASRLTTTSAGVSTIAGKPLKTTIGTLVAESTGGDINLFNTGDFTVESLKFDAAGSLLLSARSNDPKAGAANYGKITITQSGVRNSGTQTYNGNVVLSPLGATSTASPFTFTAAGVTFNGLVDSDATHRDLKTMTTGVAEFFGNVGTGSAPASFQTGATGGTTIHGAFNADGQILFSNNTILADNAALHTARAHTTSASNGIVFGGKTLSLLGNITARKSGGVTPVTIDTQGDNILVASKVTSSQGAATFTSRGGDVTFQQSLAGAVDLKVNTLTAAGVKAVASAKPATVTASEYGGDATFKQDATLGSLDVRAKNVTVFSVHALTDITLMPDEALRVTTGLPGANGVLVNPVQALLPDGLIVINGGMLKSAGGNITLGGDRTAVVVPPGPNNKPTANNVAEVATIYSPTSLTIDAGNGTFRMGRGEKLTVAPPLSTPGTPAPTNLTILAKDAFLSDLTVFGDLTVSASHSAVINFRPPQFLLSNGKGGTSAGTVATTAVVGTDLDKGVDFFANGNISFTGATPTADPAAGRNFLQTEVRFGTGTGAVDIGPLGFLFNAKAFDLPAFYGVLGTDRNTLPGGTPLDAAPTGPSSTVLTSVFAQTLPTDSPRPTEEENISGALRARLESIGIYTRELTTAEQTERALGRILYLEVPTVDGMTAAQGEQKYEVVGNRLPRKLAEAVVASFDTIYGRDPITGQVVSPEDVTKLMNKIPNDLADAFDDYMASLEKTNGTFDPAGFREFLDSGKYPELSTYLDRVQKVFSGVENLGLTEAQWSVARRNVVNQLFSGVSIKKFDQIVEVIRTVSPAKRAALAASARARR